MDIFTKIFVINIVAFFVVVVWGVHLTNGGSVFRGFVATRFGDLWSFLSILSIPAWVAYVVII